VKLVLKALKEKEDTLVLQDEMVTLVIEVTTVLQVKMALEVYWA
jgi:hypothetical protein